jgi:glycosyltransferase involved in cell wall biosynthesis
MSLPRVALLSASAGVQAGGAEAYTFATAGGLRAMGAPVTLFHGRGDRCPCAEMGAKHATGPLLSRDGGVGTLLRRLGVFRATRISPYDLEVISRGVLSPHSWKLLRHFDVVEVQYAAETLFFRYAHPAALKILHLHGPSMPSWLPRLCRACGTQPDLVVTCSEWSRLELIARNIPWSVEVNYNGVDEGLFHPPPPADRPQEGRAFRIGFTGRLSAFKGLDTLAQTARLLGPGFEFHVVGRAEGGYQLPSAPNIFYPGVKAPASVADFLRGMDCFYFPSLRESFGIAVVEAMSTSLPVIASDVGGLPEIIRSGVDGILVPACDSEAAAACIRELSGNIELRRALGDAARATVLKRFTTAHTARRLLEIHAQWRLQRERSQPCFEPARIVAREVAQ